MIDPEIALAMQAYITESAVRGDPNTQKGFPAFPSMAMVRRFWIRMLPVSKWRGMTQIISGASGGRKLCISEFEVSVGWSEDVQVG